MRIASFLSTIILACSVFAGTAFSDEDHHRYEYEGRRNSSELYGVIEQMPENGYEGIWIIGGNAVNVGRDTYIEREHGRAATGRYVEVKGRRDGDKFIAYQIELKDDGRDYSGINSAKFYGIVENMPEDGFEGEWLVNGRSILVTKNTRIKEKYGVASVGSYVEVEGDFSGNAFGAYKIEVKDSKGRVSKNFHNSEFSGNIEKIPQEGYEGRWIVAGRIIEVGDKTLIDETLGKASFGSKAKVKGVRTGNTIVASEIKIIGMQ